MFHQYIHISEHQILYLKYVEFIVSQLELNEVKNEKKQYLFLIIYKYQSCLLLTFDRCVWSI